MRISISKSETIVLSWKRVDSPLWDGGEALSEVEGCKYLLVLKHGAGVDRWVSGQYLQQCGLLTSLLW